MGLFAVRHWRKSSSGRWTVAVAITVEIIVVIVNLKVEKVVVLSQNKRMIQTRATVIHRMGSLSLLCHCSSFLPPPFYSLVSSLQPPRILLSPPVSSTCPLPTPPLFPVLFFFFPTSLSFFWFLLYLKIAIHLCNHSIFPPSSIPFVCS